MWPGFDSRTRRHMWVEFVVSSRPCSEGFSPGIPVFPPSSKTNISKFQFDVEFQGHRFVSHIRLLSVTLAKQSRFIYFYSTDVPLPPAPNSPPSPPPTAIPMDKAVHHNLWHLEQAKYLTGLMHWSAELPRKVYSRYDRWKEGRSKNLHYPPPPPHLSAITRSTRIHELKMTFC